MAAYNFNDPAPVFQNILGTAHLATGSLTFYAIGTTTPKDTWNDPDMAPAHLNANPIDLDSSGRPAVEIFMDGDYTVKLTDGLGGTGTTIWTRDVVPGVDAGLSIPALVAGEFLTNDGATLQWDAVRQVPDPTGQSGKALTSTGSGTTWTAFPSAPTLDVVIASASIRIGDGTAFPNPKVLIQRGTGTAPNTGTKVTNVGITFPTAYAALWHVGIVVTTAATTPASELPTHSVTGWTQGSPSTGVTVNFNIPDDDSSANHKFSTTVPFSWIAFGTVTG